MKFSTTLLLGSLLLGALALLIISEAKAQTATPEPNPDVQLRKTAGVYPIGCVAPSDLDMLELCFVRVDGPVILELGCVSAGPDEEVHTEVDVQPTPQQNAVIKCYAIDWELLVSDYSLNSGLIDFTAPRRPRIIAWLPRYGACHAPVFNFDV